MKRRRPTRAWAISRSPVYGPVFPYAVTDLPDPQPNQSDPAWKGHARRRRAMRKAARNG